MADQAWSQFRFSGADGTCEAEIAEIDRKEFSEGFLDWDLIPKWPGSEMVLPPC